MFLRGIRMRGSAQPRIHALPGGRIARRDLPHLAHALEVADVEGIQANEFARLAGLDLARALVADSPELLPRTLRQQTRRLQSVVFEDRHALPSGRQARSPQRSLHRTGGHKGG